MAERQAFGIDINEYSRTGGINYQLVKSHLGTGAYDFLIAKASLGFTINPLLAEQRQNMEANNIPYATYHFLDPRFDMRVQVQKYFNAVGTDQRFYILDIESPQIGVRVPNKAEVLVAIDEIQRLTHQQPVLYSGAQILSNIGFMNEAAQFRLWIAWYPYDATRPSQNLQYRYFHDFTQKFSHRLPVTVIDTPLANNTILWQFSAKGDGPFYIYSPFTDDPRFPVGMKDADLNVSIQTRTEFMSSMFGVVPPVTGEVEHQPEQAPYPGLTNQMMINAIFKAAAPFSADPWQDWIVRAGLEYLAIPNANRNKKYSGPKVEDIPNLTEQEKAAILAAMG
jgi:hypothetical protein